MLKDLVDMLASFYTFIASFGSAFIPIDDKKESGEKS